jgi:hypothetical protein
MHMTPHQVRALAVAAHIDPRTAIRWLAGLAVNPAIAHRLNECARELGYVAPTATAAIASAPAALMTSEAQHHG